MIKLNLRATPDLLKQIDEARAAMLRDDSIGRIPSRSEFVRLAVDAYLEGLANACGGRSASMRGQRK